MNARTIGFGLAAWLSVAALSPWAHASGLSPQDVEASLNKGGKQRTLETYFDCLKYEGSAYERIATGSPAWIALAEKMIAYSDACYTEGIQSALGEAMRKSPRTVLPLVDRSPTLGASYICLPFISNEQPIEAQLKEIEISRRAIQKVGDRGLAPQKSACLRFIRTLATGLKTQQAVTKK